MTNPNQYTVSKKNITVSTRTDYYCTKYYCKSDLQSDLCSPLAADTNEPPKHVITRHVKY